MAAAQVVAPDVAGLTGTVGQLLRVDEVGHAETLEQRALLIIRGGSDVARE